MSLAIRVNLSVRLSVCHARALSQNKTIHCGYLDTTRKGNHSNFLTPTVVGGRRPLPSEVCSQSDPSTLQKRRLLKISAYNVSIVRDSEKRSVMTNIKSTTGFPTSYRWSPYVTPESPKGCLKAIFCFFNKIQLQSNKVCYEISLYENFQRQSYSMAIPLTVRKYWRDM